MILTHEKFVNSKNFPDSRENRFSARRNERIRVQVRKLAEGRRNRISMARNEKFRVLPEVENVLRVRVGIGSGRALSGGRAREVWVAGAREWGRGRKGGSGGGQNDVASGKR